MRWALTIDYNPVREKLMIKKVGVVDKPETIIRYKRFSICWHIEVNTTVIQNQKCVKKHSLISKFNSDEKADKYKNCTTWLYEITKDQNWSKSIHMISFL